MDSQEVLLDEDHQSILKRTRWLKRHLINRTNNKPIKPVEPELQEYLEWLPHLQEFYDEAVDIMCKGLLPKKIRLLFFLIN